MTLDPEIVEVLKEHRTRCRQRAESLGLSLKRDAYVFSPAPDGSEPMKPDTRYAAVRKARRSVGVSTPDSTACVITRRRNS